MTHARLRHHALDLTSLPTSLQDALDEAVALKTNPRDRTRALTTLEQLIAQTCIPTESSDTRALDAFLVLQDTFECNIPSRLLLWISSVTSRLEQLCLKGSLDPDRAAEFNALTNHISQCLSLIQGVALNHASSKRYLGRKHPLQTLLDLLLVSRLLPQQEANLGGSMAREKHTSGPSAPLSAAILDTLLCILVDSSVALRTLEEVAGIQIAVKILKRAGTPREVRMKCLEFLYFYLLDETSGDLGHSTVAGRTPLSPSTSTPTSPLFSSTSTIGTSTVPSTPRNTYRAAPLSTPATHSRNAAPSTTTAHSRTRSLASISGRRSSTSSSSGGSDGGSSVSLASLASDASATSAESSRISTSDIYAAAKGESRPSAMHRRHTLLQEVDYTPASPAPRKTARLAGGPGDGPRLPSATGAAAAPAGMGTPVPATPAKRTPPSAFRPSHSRSRSAAASPMPPPASPLPALPTPYAPRSSASHAHGGEHAKRMSGAGASARTTEEKRAILGGMLGNVDALIEGVRKAGIWGLA